MAHPDFVKARRTPLLTGTAALPILVKIFEEGDAMRTGLVLFILLLAGAEGCSSIVHGKMQEVQINTVPPGAKATIGTQTCVTPCLMMVNRGEQSLRVEKGNYKKTFDLDKDFQFGTTICGNICWVEIGAIVDLANGAAWEIKPINLKLNAADPGLPLTKD